MAGNKGTVCVTGATGFIASWLIKTLLESGYTIRGTIRRSGNRDLKYLTDLPGAAERLQLIEADLNNPESFDSAVEGCIGVFHTAHPIDTEDNEPEDVIVKRAIDGTLGILKATLKSKTVKRVIYTSTASAVIFNGNPQEVADETSWSDIDFVRQSNMHTALASYVISKTLTEKAAQEFAAKNGLDVVTVIPTFVSGPFLCSYLPTSIRLTMAMIFGKSELYGQLLWFPMVHVDDIAKAHIFLFEHPEAKGRYICSRVTVCIDEMAKFLSSKYPEYPIPSQEVVKEVQGFKLKDISSNKLLDAGFGFKHGLDDMYDDAIKSCKERGIL